MRRGEVRWATLPIPDAARRPVLIISSDAFNASRIGTVLAVVISSQRELSAAPGNVAVGAAETGLPRDGVVVVSQVVTLDRGCVGEVVGMLKQGVMRQVVGGLGLVQGLRAV
ncbi:MAG: type II toxin-antitoxin system PemK/MazF family toxin [Gammaproteobacteria bacterium]|nr:type II toxin-antitoxin system PemK/MazF family toxin [Gammaproteobacteria bacterium]